MDKSKSDDQEDTANGAPDDIEPVIEEEDELEVNEQEEETPESLSELNDKYLRLYADFENYKKFAAKNRGELLQYSNENIMNDLLTVIDHLELALQHASGDAGKSSLAEGVEMTLKELTSILNKHGLSYINTIDEPFDPNLHQAMSQIETDEVDENRVIKEFRKGYMFKDRVLRASLVEVSKKPTNTNDSIKPEEEDL
jgi:molecular chaperone GrpE